MQAQKQPSPDQTADHRLKLRQAFLDRLGWGHVTMEEMAADASLRRYYRLQGAPKPLLMMQDPPDRAPTLPPVMVEPFIKISNHLRGLGLHAPEIVAQDIPNGLLVIEDFGDDTYTRLFNGGEDPKGLYELAVDVLAHLHKHPAPASLNLPAYDADVLVSDNAVMVFLDWYYPLLSGQKPSAEMRESYRDLWRGLLAKLPQAQEGIVLRDYHVDNLMITKGDGLMRCGLLDFQDAMTGQFSYDLMSLLEDARRAMPEDLQKHLYERYLAAMGDRIDRAAFEYSFRILGGQRHARVLGLFVRLPLRDGKERYAQWIPHVRGLLMKVLEKPELAPVAKWFKDHDIDLSKPIPPREKWS